MSFNEFLNCISMQNVKKAYPDLDTLISREELKTIYTGMSRANDFRDATKILSDVCLRKMENGNRYLTRVKLNNNASHGIIPSTGINIYEYSFADPTTSHTVIEGCVNPGRYDEPIFKGTICNIL